MRFASTLIVLAMLGASPPPQQSQVAQRPGRLLIDAVVTDTHGMPVLDVKPSELEVWIVGYRIPIETVTFVTPTPEVPSSRSITILLDDINVDAAVMPRAREAARQFVNRMVPEDRIAL